MTKQATFKFGDLDIGNRVLQDFYAIKMFKDSSAYWNPVCNGHTDFNPKQYPTREAAEKAMKTPTFKEVAHRCAEANRPVTPEIVHISVMVTVGVTNPKEATIE